MRLVMLGTGDFAAPSFASLYGTSHEVLALVTQPERTGRGHHSATVSRMKQTALDHGTPVFQPESVNTPESLEELRKYPADLYIVAAYGQILSQELLSIPPRGTVNVHASLLPKYRGAAPINYAIWKGETETGVSIIRVLPQLDAGPILGKVTTPIGPRETAGELEDRLSELAVPALLQALEDIEQGCETAIVQEASLVTRAPKMKKTQGAIDWTQPAEQIDRHLRAMQPWPVAYTFVHFASRAPVRVQIRRIEPRPEFASPAGTPPGTVLQATRGGLILQTGSIAVEIPKLQPDGKRELTAVEFLNGMPVQVGDLWRSADPRG